ncbi:MAG: endonuclease III domain-containing protein [Candidatus Omnitrophota bacterium]
MVGAILTQNTNWANVEKAINNLKKHEALSARKLYKLPRAKVAALIRPAGYYNIKAGRLKNFLDFLNGNYGGNIRQMSREKLDKLRLGLLSVNGIGPETADSILLYALDKPIFVIDAYTKRIFSRHRFFSEDCDYHAAQNLFSKNLKNDVKLFNEYHALIVKLGKDFCLKNKPRCSICPLKSFKDQEV